MDLTADIMPFIFHDLYQICQVDKYIWYKTILILNSFDTFFNVSQAFSHRTNSSESIELH